MNNKHSGCMMWPGSSMKYRNRDCTFSQPLDKRMNMTERVDLTMKWLTHETTPANLVMFYCEQPDDTGHAYGTDSQKVSHT